MPYPLIFSSQEAQNKNPFKWVKVSISINCDNGHNLDDVLEFAGCGRQTSSRQGGREQQEQVHVPRHPARGQVRQGAAPRAGEPSLHDVCGGEPETAAIPNWYEGKP